MKAKVSIIMGSISDLEIMKAACQVFEDFRIHFCLKILSAHRSPDELQKYIKELEREDIKIIIAAAGMSAHLAGVIASHTLIPVIAVPIKTSLEGLDALYSCVQMPPGIPVGTVGINAAKNAALLAIHILAINNKDIKKALTHYRKKLKQKILDINKDISKLNFKFMV